MFDRTLHQHPTLLWVTQPTCTGCRQHPWLPDSTPMEMGRERKFPPPSFHLLLPQLASPFKFYTDVQRHRQAPAMFPVFGA